MIKKESDFMNSIQLKEKLKKISKEREVDFNILLRIYMYDRFLERLAVSKYRDNFILKGGFYLSSFLIYFFFILFCKFQDFL